MTWEVDKGQWYGNKKRNNRKIKASNNLLIEISVTELRENKGGKYRE